MFRARFSLARAHIDLSLSARVATMLAKLKKNVVRMRRWVSGANQLEGAGTHSGAKEPPCGWMGGGAE